MSSHAATAVSNAGFCACASPNSKNTRRFCGQPPAWYAAAVALRGCAKPSMGHRGSSSPLATSSGRGDIAGSEYGAS